MAFLLKEIVAYLSRDVVDFGWVFFFMPRPPWMEDWPLNHGS
jgi:hypothetical protein